MECCLALAIFRAPMRAVAMKSKITQKQATKNNQDYEPHNIHKVCGRASIKDSKRGRTLRSKHARLDAPCSSDPLSDALCRRRVIHPGRLRPRLVHSG